MAAILMKKENFGKKGKGFIKFGSHSEKNESIKPNKPAALNDQ